MVIGFVLLSTQRSGSTWVIDMLNSHPQIAAYSELLLENGQGRPTWGGAKDRFFWHTYLNDKRNSADERSVRTLLFDYLDEIYAPRQEIKAVGFKLMYGQAGAYSDLHDYLLSKDIRIIHLIRKNPLDIVLSKELAAAREVYHARDDADVPKIRVCLDTDDLLHRLRWQGREVQRNRERFVNTSLSYREILYENLRSDPAEFKGLLSFLGVDAETWGLKSTLRITNQMSHQELIENYESVKLILQDTPFSDLLN